MAIDTIHRQSQMYLNEEGELVDHDFELLEEEEIEEEDPINEALEALMDEVNAMLEIECKVAYIFYCLLDDLSSFWY